MGESYEVTIGPAEWEFVPTYGDGKITAKLHQLTVEEYDGCINIFSGTIDRSKMITYGLLELLGLKVNGEAVKSAEGLLSAGNLLMPLFTELWIEINKGSEVTGEEVKNS